jgi:uracil-DNA glycosylase
LDQLGPLRQEWRTLLDDEFQQSYLSELSLFLRSEAAAGKEIYPAESEYFASLNTTPPDAVKVVVLGQDPYHGPGQAHGLSFSIKDGGPPPPSLRNIFRELVTDVGIATPERADLTEWAAQGVLLLNNVLTVERGLAGSHQGKGWETFTDAVVRAVNQGGHPVVFMLWGNHAQTKGAAIDRSRHCILQASHPSPLSARRGFFGCKHFTKANAFLRAHQRDEVEWSLSP